jgi:deazaflavin-dependent oxidoreductase (nitroreductase family)
VNDLEDFNRQIVDEFRANGGRVGGQFEGRTLLLLHTTGARTGKPRVNALAYRHDADHLVVFASKAGAPTNPDWYHNLLANPKVTVEVGTELYQAVARIAIGEERERLWADQKRDVAAFADYESRTDRPIPVIVLERRT